MNKFTQANKIFNQSLKSSLAFFPDFNFIYSSDEKLVPSTGKAIKAMFDASYYQNKPFYVFDGSNDAELLTFTPETNLLYRALHDIDHALHYEQGLGTTSLKSEMFLNCLMANRAFGYAVRNGYSLQDALLTFFIVYHDTVGQALYYAKNNDFVTNQLENTINLLNECDGYKLAKRGMLSQSNQIMKNMLLECGLLNSKYK